jgi:N-acetylglutamate synthase-like GNAT family acetyltransferase
MIIDNIRFTKRAIELIKYASNIAKESDFNSIHPVHLFLGELKIDCEVTNELKSIIDEDTTTIKYKLNSAILEKVSNEYVRIKIDDTTITNISNLTKDILFEAKRTAALYEEHGQVFVSDGQILKAVLNCDDKLTTESLNNFDKDLIFSIAISPRDMRVNLDKDFKIKLIENVCIKKVTNEDKEMLREFVMENFYERWAKTVDYGLTLDDIPIYIALINSNIVGFAGYNISKKRKGYFGPLGVLKAYRDKKIGQSLLNICLIDMKKLGFKTCIIGNAGSIEFYEKACGAKIIPLN